MTSCDEYQRRIVALFDNEAKDEDLRSVAGHLQDCPECRAFCLELVGIRRALVSASTPSLSPAARQEILDNIKADQSNRRESRGGNCARLLHLGRLGRWAAVLVISLLSIVCFALGRTAKDLRLKLGAAEQQVAAIHEQAKLTESQERQQKAISALYFRMAELEERVNRSSPSQRASFPVPEFGRSERQSNL
jgi:anti-sigma factor RsiW